jgi:hypothetical protein
MTSNFNTLYHGEADEAADALEDLKEPGNSSHRAALTNALRKIAKLEARQEEEFTRLESQLERVTDRVETRLTDLEFTV